MIGNPFSFRRYLNHLIIWIVRLFQLHLRYIDTTSNVTIFSIICHNQLVSITYLHTMKTVVDQRIPAKWNKTLCHDTTQLNLKFFVVVLFRWDDRRYAEAWIPGSYTCCHVHRLRGWPSEKKGHGTGTSSFVSKIKCWMITWHQCSLLEMLLLN